MVKKEKEGECKLCLPDSWVWPPPVPDAPPGFPPQPLKPSTSAAAVSSRNHTPSSLENGFSQGLTPDSTRQQHPPRRTSRKRSRPQFYSPPPAQQQPTGRRRRGRPPKARIMSQLSCQEIGTRNGDQVSAASLRQTQKQTSCFFTSLQITKEQSRSRTNNQVCEQSSQITQTVDENQARAAPRSTFLNRDIEETVTDISLTEVPDPIHGVALDDWMNPSIDPKILQHVANALHNMAGRETSLDETKVLKSRSSDIDKTLFYTLKAINKNHGDITQDCSLKSDCMKTLVLLGICKVVQDLEKKQLKDIDISTLDPYYTAVRDAENMNVNVQWLHDRLDEIKDAVILREEAKGMVDERNRRLESIDNRNKELLTRKVEVERLKSEIQDIEDQLAREVIMMDELNRNIGTQTSEFPHTYLMDGLV
ncbi:uncharacterized protein LOC105157792 [Sesamum indicum]|uniref:Uncharacterized protein LOC105157792 n=1 Tax=Sesamum indicum TaxID=4182 RepID=A0A6I9STC1_SESIN|nr:uncharacterized protein LOC105157792 [Sesamum indicum]